MTKHYLRDSLWTWILYFVLEITVYMSCQIMIVKSLNDCEVPNATGISLAVVIVMATIHQYLEDKFIFRRIKG